MNPRFLLALGGMKPQVKKPFSYMRLQHFLLQSVCNGNVKPRAAFTLLA